MKQCLVCNVELVVKPREGKDRFAKRKLCSLKCRQIYITKLRHKNWKSKNCLRCGNEIKRHYHKLIFCSNACAKSYYRGENSPNWKGGRKKHGEYVQLFVGKEHPLSDLHGYMMEHRAIMEKHLIDTNAEKYLVESKGKKYLNPLIKIHHKNHNKSDNRISNLVPMFSQKEHFHFNYCPHCEHCNKSGELLENPTRTISNQA